MKKLFALAIFGAAFSGFAADFSASLTPEQEAHQPTPGTATGPRSGFGSGTLTLNGDDFTYDMTFSGLRGNAVNAHIHGPTPTNPNGAPGTDAPVIFPIFVAGNVDPDGKGGHFSGTVNNITPAQLADLNAGLWYFNVHTTEYGGGEIRGQITAVPEPSTIALAVGAGAMMLGLRRKRNG